LRTASAPLVSADEDTAGFLNYGSRIDLTGITALEFACYDGRLQTADSRSIQSNAMASSCYVYERPLARRAVVIGFRNRAKLFV